MNFSLFIKPSTFDKRIMIDPISDLNLEADLSQKRLLLKNPENHKVQIITNVFIYCAQYYPVTRQLARDTVSLLEKTHMQELYQAFEHLYSCLEREIINGPSSSFIPASELPINAKNDESFLFANTQPDLIAMMSTYEQLGMQVLIPSNRLKELLWYDCQKFLSMKSVQESKFFLRDLRDELEIDGESWTDATPFPSLIILLSDLLSKIVNSENLSLQLLKKFKLMRARLSYLHNKQLKFPVKKLCDIALSSYKDVLTLSKKQVTMDDYIQLLLEYAFVLLFYYKYSQCEKLLRHCSQLLKMQVEFTGRLGRRTKYQTFDTPLLVMQLVHRQEKNIEKEIHGNEENQENSEIDLIDPKQLVAKEKGALKEVKIDNVEASTFDDESILLEIPKFAEGNLKEEQKVLKEVNQRHLLVALGILYFEWRSTPHDQMLMQSISAAVAALLNYKISTSFSFSFALLLLRSLNQFPRIKNTQRALDQLEKLKLSFNGKVNKNTSNLYATPYQTYLGFILIMAEKYMEVGLSIAAVELFQQVGLFQECVDGLIAKNYREKALQITKRLVEEKGKNPRLLCMLGDIYKDKEIHYYQEAWELSKGTCARAQRSLGWFYFGKNDYQKAAQSFSKATKASYYHPSTWFTLGCTYLRMNQFDKALKAFSECISIDQTQGEAWGNMASCYMYQKKFKEAYSTLSQAVKYSEGNWKLWANLLSVSLSLKQFYKYFESIEKVTVLGHPQLLTEEVFKKVAQVMRYQIQAPGRKRVLYTHKNRIDRLFALLQQKIGQNPLVWRGKTLYYIELLNYFQTVAAHYSFLHSQNKLDINDLIPGFQTLESTTQESATGISESKIKIVDFKQCELNMMMRVGWDSDKLQCKRVKQVLTEYTEIYKQFSPRNDKADFRLFVEGVTQKISQCMEEPFKLGLDWL